jgi:hypothetical protein
MLYGVQLATEAEEAYVALYEEAQHYCDVGQNEHPVVVAFEDVHSAMVETLPFGPCTEAWTMAGDLSHLWVLNLNSVTIVYVIDDELPDEPIVIVQTISTRRKDGSMRRWLSARMETGELAPVLASLGIEPQLMRMQVNSRMVH